MNKLKTWLISGRDLPTLKINAYSFDQALATARRINPNYNTGQVSETFDEAANWYFKGDNKFVDDVLKLYEINKKGR